MSSVNWNGIGNALSGVANAIASAGVTGTAANTIFQSVTNLLNQNEKQELQICSQILAMSTDPAVVAELSMKLATEQGIPQAAANLALQLTKPGVDVTQVVLEIEQIIRQGG
jgi:hypothetical protein